MFFPNKFLATSRVDNAKLETRLDTGESNADLQPLPARNIAGITWEQIATTREAGFEWVWLCVSEWVSECVRECEINTLVTSEQNLPNSCIILLLECKNCWIHKPNKDGRRYASTTQTQHMEDIWPQEEPLNKIERESNQCNYQSDHLDDIEETRQFIRDCSRVRISLFFEITAKMNFFSLADVRFLSLKELMKSKSLWSLVRKFSRCFDDCLV